MTSIPAILGISPFERPDAGLVVALSRASALGVLDLGRDARVARQALATAARLVPAGFGVRIPDYVDQTGIELPAQAKVVVISPFRLEERWEGRTVLVQVTSLTEARAAANAGVHGLIVKGSESGGRVGEETSFVLLQQILREIALPAWVQGGIGVHSAAACVAAGARGVVLDTQLALLKDASPPSADLVRALATMDGSQTAVVGQHRVYSRPSLPPPPANASAKEVAGRLGTADLKRDLLSAGQDAAFARPFADRFGNVRGLVRALTAAMQDHVDAARAKAPIGKGSPLAAEHGITYPIFQGPMTRVSDRASFADAVASGGGLPFLALSLMRGDAARNLLAETATRLAGKTWGVGLLGFLPPDLREEQLKLIQDARPPVAIIAGGRPAQAVPLEEAGIATYLHVPSPGLLDLFVKDGARRFVFEGRECGGHVGPLASFVLWEMAIERLLAETDEVVAELCILFAGGIHDARSAAMVSAMAAPLAARGAKIGVLMGTAYLFTEEAVSSGAILPAFQDEAIRCQRTVLVETAPGHATRCVDSDFVRDFASERVRLEGEGLDSKTVWAALEKLNLGRLRIAAKGMRRDGDAVVAVDEESQRREGMYMIGQVAALRTDRCTIQELHADVAEGAARHLEAVAEARADIESAIGGDALDIAIVGMACMFPDAPDVAAFWKNITSAHNAVREVAKERWNPDLYYSPKGTGDKTPSKWGGFLPNVLFDPMTHGIPPRSLAAIEPTQLLSLEIAKRALTDAGYDGDRGFNRERTSVIFGAQSGTDLANAYGFRASFRQYLGEMPAELDEKLPKLTEDSFPGVLANVIAGRIANRLDLGGVNYTVDAACASSLAALDIACKELASKTSDMVICGGADLHNGINDYLLFASVHALSPTGQCKPFDASADGIALGEGVAALVLKRLADAERDGDRVYAVIKGVGGSSDGKSLGLTAPRPEGQARALARAYARAGVSPADIGLVEAHGTGTVVGDRTELATLTEVFGAAGALPHSCTLGSVKSQIGHTKCVAGIAGVIKAALAIHHRVLPPTNNVRKPNSAYTEGSPFVFRDTARPWASESRKAGVSAFGFGGTNFHVVLDGYEAQPPTTGLDAWPAELFLFRGFEKKNATARLKALADRLAQKRDADGAPADRLRDLALTIANEGTGAPVQIAIVAESTRDLEDKVARALRSEASEGVFLADGSSQFGASSVAFVFPGQGSQRVGMMRDLFVAFPDLGDLLVAGARWVDTIFPTTAFTLEQKNAQDAALKDTTVAQPALGIAGLAMARTLQRCGVEPAMTAGHSYGELVALTVAGAISERDLLDLSWLRATAIREACQGAPGGMAAVKASLADAERALAGIPGVTFANHNAPDQCVIAGSDVTIDAACAVLGEHGLGAKRIPVACAFHSPIVAGAAGTFGRKLATLTLASPKVPVYSNTTATPYPSDPALLGPQLSEQLAYPVRFVDEIEAMYAAGARIFVEVGPGGVMTDLVGRILGDRPHTAIATEKSGTPGLTSLVTALARLAAAGVEIDTRALFDGRDAETLDLATPAAKKSLWVVNGMTARPLEGELPDFAMKPILEPIALVTEPTRGVAASSSDREQTVLEYMRSMREVVEGQRQIMLKYLGESVVAPQVLDIAPVAQTIAAPASASAPAPKAALPAPAVVPVALRPLEILIATVSDRTGYPPDMLDPDLDLEADLGIDSIKRIEILGTLNEKLGLKPVGAAKQSQVMEEIASVKTLRGIATWLEKRIGGAAETPAAAAAPVEKPAKPSLIADAPPSELPPPSVKTPVLRYVLEVTPIEPAKPNGVAMKGRRFAMTNDAHGVSKQLTTLLEASGATVRVLEDGTALGKEPVDGLLFLDSLSSSSEASVKSLFSLTKEAVLGDARWIVAATGRGGSFGHENRGAVRTPAHGGVAGLLKSVAKEWPALRVSSIDLHPEENASNLANHIYAELIADEVKVEVGYASGKRQELRVTTGEGRDLPVVAPAVALDPGSVVLVTGGARGITAKIATAMAKRFGCALEIVGRSALPEANEDAELSKAETVCELRKVLLARAKGTPTTPAAIDAVCYRVLKDREIRATFAAMEATGVPVRYHALDVRDEAAFGALIDDIHARHGRLDGVIHGAGLVEDKLLRHKTHESFDRVFDTKVASAKVLAEKLQKSARFVVFFSSISGAFGNEGQVDYAAANSALDTLAHHLCSESPARVLTINWGPWRGVGMVSPELEREYARRGIGLIDPDEGVERFFDELLNRRDTQVILTAARLEEKPSKERGNA